MNKLETPNMGGITSDSPSPLMRLTTLFLRIQGKLHGPKRWPKIREKLFSRSSPEAAAIPNSLKRICQICEKMVDGHRVFTLIPHRSRSDVRVLYTHGGGYVESIQAPHWKLIEKIIRTTGASFVVPLYPLAPEHDHRSAFAMLEAIYRDLSRTVPSKMIVLMGDSAGGGLALAQAMRYRDAGLNKPGRIVLFAPWLDITMSNPEAASLEFNDVMLGIDALIFCGERWAGSETPRLPYLSPIFGELSELPPIDLYQGANDLLVADARRFCVLARRAGVASRLFEYRGAFHVFMAATFTRESRDVVARVGADLAELARKK